jgi:hypothetical protein
VVFLDGYWVCQFCGSKFISDIKPPELALNSPDKKVNLNKSEIKDTSDSVPKTVRKPKPWTSHFEYDPVVKPDKPLPKAEPDKPKNDEPFKKQKEEGNWFDVSCGCTVMLYGLMMFIAFIYFWYISPETSTFWAILFSFCKCLVWPYYFFR